MADTMGYYKWYLPKKTIEDVDIDIRDYLRIESELQIAETLGCDESDVDYRHRWYDLDDPADRATALSQDEFTMDLHRGEFLLESYGTRKVVVS